MAPSFTAVSWSVRTVVGLALVLCLHATAAAAAASCGDEFLSGVHNPYRFCSSVVDYSYVIADGSSADAMNTAARALAERYYVEFFPTACKESMKRSICAQTYLPCDGGAATKKPCASLCEATAGEDGVCNGLMELYGYQPDCADSDIFDASNDPAVCNALAHVEGVQLVADRNEPYVGSACTNFVEHYFVPEAAAYNAPLAPMPLPNLFQGYQEASAADWLSKMPKIESDECQTAFHKVVCATIFMKPQTSDVVADTFGPVYLQQFPARELCTDYADKCQWILDKAPTLGIDCSTSYPGWDGNPLYLYPESSQYVKGVMYEGAWTLICLVALNTKRIKIRLECRKYNECVKYCRLYCHIKMLSQFELISRNDGGWERNPQKTKNKNLSLSLLSRLVFQKHRATKLEVQYILPSIFEQKRRSLMHSRCQTNNPYF